MSQLSSNFKNNKCNHFNVIFQPEFLLLNQATPIPPGQHFEDPWRIPVNHKRTPTIHSVTLV